MLTGRSVSRYILCSILKGNALRVLFSVTPVLIPVLVFYPWFDQSFLFDILPRFPSILLVYFTNINNCINNFVKL